MFNGLVKVKVDNGTGRVSARELHEALKVQQDFSDWIKKQLDAVDAEEKDYEIVWYNTNDTNDPFKKVVNNTNDINVNSMNRKGYRQEYILNIDIAKEICMVIGVAPRTNSETKRISKEVRKYLIDCEKYILDTKQFSEFMKWREREGKDTHEFYSSIENDKRCIGLSLALSKIVSYKYNFPFRYNKEQIFQTFLNTDNKDPWNTKEATLCLEI